MLTENQIKKAIARAPASGKKSIELKDDGERGVGRLALLIRPFPDRVTAEWYAVWYRDGKRSSTKIANYPTLSLGEARRQFREEFSPAISTGGNPVGSHARHQRAPSVKITVKGLFAAYVADLRRKDKRSADRIENYILPPAAAAIGEDKPAAEVTAADIVPYLAEIHGRGAIVLAKQARAYISAAFSFGMKAEHDYTRKTDGAEWGIKANPVLAISTDKSAARARDRNLSVAEFKAFWDWLGGQAADSMFAPAAKLMMSTGQRTEEILRIGYQSRYVPRERMLVWDKTKNGRPHSIPLPRQAIDVIEQTVANANGLLFPTRFNPAEPAKYNGIGRLVREYIAETGCVPFCPRDIRRTWKTLAGAAGITKEIRDRIQNHAKGDVSSRHYDRYEYLAEKRAAMAQWSAYLERILAGELDERTSADVVSIGNRQQAA